LKTSHLKYPYIELLCIDKMNIDIFELICEYFDDPDDTINLSRINKVIYENRKILSLNNIFSYNKSKDIPLFSKYKYKHIDSEITLIKNAPNVYKKLGIKVISNVDELSNLEETINELRIDLKEQVKKDNRDFFEIYTKNFSNIKSIVLNNVNDLEIDTVPKNIQKIKFGPNYKQKYPILPEKLRYLELYKNYNLIIKQLPDCLELEYLVVHDKDYYTQFDPQKLSKLKFLRISSRYMPGALHLPDSLEELEIYSESVERISFENNSKLKRLRIESEFLDPINFLPNSLEYLYLDSKYTHSILKIPNNIIKIYLNKDNISSVLSYDQILENRDKLYSIKTGKKFVINLFDDLMQVNEQ